MDMALNPDNDTPSGPRHVAIVMDGNRRWAHQRGLTSIEGHRAGVQNLNRVLQALGDHGVSHVTIYVFSTENWNRAANEVGALQELLQEIIAPKSRELHQRGVQIRHIGDLKGVAGIIRRGIQGAMRLTRNNDQMVLNVAFNYGSRQEIARAVQSIVRDGVPVKTIDDAKIAAYLDTGDQPDVDLMIRTGGEHRLSNFLLWQSAYAEIYFSELFWPDFDATAVAEAVDWYRGRQRRFGI
jgi:undecaprenyl diphosphate synthase